MSNTILEGRNLSKSYQLGQATVDVLRGVSVSVPEGETLAILGASGAGKSTLLHMLGALDRPSSGEVFYKGQDVYAMSAAARGQLRASKIGFVFQAFYLLPELDITENVMLAAMARSGSLGDKAMRDRARGLLDRVGLGHRMDHRPLELSGGEQQRVAIVRAVMNEPEVVLADEPTGNLDSKTGGLVLEYLFALTSEKRHTLVLVTHNDALAGLCHRRIALKDGALADSLV